MRGVEAGGLHSQQLRVPFRTLRRLDGCSLMLVCYGGSADERFAFRLWKDFTRGLAVKGEFGRECSLEPEETALQTNSQVTDEKRTKVPSILWGGANATASHWTLRPCRRPRRRNDSPVD